MKARKININPQQIWYLHKSGILLTITALVITFLPTLLYLSFFKNHEAPRRENANTDYAVASPTETVAEYNTLTYSLDESTCNAQTIACDQQFKDNKDLACGSFKSVVVDELLKRNESPCKGLERTYVETELNKACQQGCTGATTPTKTPTPTTIEPTHANNPTPTPALTVEIQYVLPGIGKKQFENNSPKTPRRKTQVDLYNQSASKIETKEIEAKYDAQSGTFRALALFTVNPNWYYVIIKTDGALSKKAVTKPTVLVAGEITGDNTVDIADYNLFIACFKGLPLCGIDAKKLADFTDDGNIYIDDLNVLQRAFATGKGDLVGD